MDVVHRRYQEKRSKTMRLVGKGNTAEVYEYGNKKVCKLFYEGYPHDYVALEFRNALEMHKNGIKIPQPFQVVTMEKRKGIVYEKIKGKTLSEKMYENDTDQYRFLKMFVNLQFEIISHHTQNVLPYKKYLMEMLKRKKINNHTIFRAICSLPDDNCLLHGDFHPDNILVTSDGSPVVIDFMNVCHGPALYDIARTYFIIRQYDSSLADGYLSEIGAFKTDIIKYLNIIELCRKYEG